MVAVRSLHRHMELYPDTRGWRASHYAADNLYWYAGVALLDKDLEAEVRKRGASRAVFQKGRPPSPQ